MENYISWFIAFYMLYIMVKIYISVMQIGYVKKIKFAPAVLLSPKAYIEAADYGVAKERISIISSILDFIIMFFWINFGFSYLEQNMVGVGSIIDMVIYVDIFIVINYIIALPIDLYTKFILDEKFGFNKTSLGLFIVDELKGGLLFLTFGSAVIYGLAYFITNFDSWWVISFGFLFAIIVLINMIYPTLIAPIFNKFLPLEDDELKTKIENLLLGVGFKSSGVFMIDASKRDTRLNAYFGGLGATKRVVLFDTLIKKLTHNELLAVLGHEIGHFKHGDIYKNIVVMGIMIFSFFAILGNLPNELFLEMNVSKNGATLIAFFFILTTPLGFFLMPIINYFSREHEFAADKFGGELQDKDDLKRALIKLSNENKKFPKSHILNRIFYETHPSVLERIEVMGGMPNESETSKAVDEKIKNIEFDIFSSVKKDV